MSDTGADHDPWPIPAVYLKFVTPELIEDYGKEVCALIYHIIRGVVDGKPESGGVSPCLRYIPDTLRKEYGEELPEILGRAALGCLSSADVKSGVPAYSAPVLCTPQALLEGE